MKVKNKNEAQVRNEAQVKSETEKKSHAFIRILLVLLCLGVIAFQQAEIMYLHKKVKAQGYVYVYDLEQVLKGVKLDDLNREFEAKISILNDEVMSAQEQISSLKDSKVKDNFSDVYLKSLKLKRDTMMQEYTRAIQNITNEINVKVTELAEEKNAVVVFDKHFITVSTPNVVDLTEDLVKRIQISRPRVLDE